MFPVSMILNMLHIDLFNYKEKLRSSKFIL